MVAGCALFGAGELEGLAVFIDAGEDRRRLFGVTVSSAKALRFVGDDIRQRSLLLKVDVVQSEGSESSPKSNVVIYFSPHLLYQTYRTWIIGDTYRSANHVRFAKVIT